MDIDKNTSRPKSRRDFIKLSAMAGTAMVLPLEALPFTFKKEALNIGLIADVHNDIMHDGEERLQAFISESNDRNLDFIVQMGDFCIPRESNQKFMSIWNSYARDTHHVIGNHDTDLGYSKEQVREFWDMPANYYSFDHKGIHFIILDGNDANPQPWEGYHRYIGKEQQEWLRQDLQKTDNPTIIFSHQTLELEDGGVANLKDVQEILEAANASAGFQKVLCCLSGHHHTDFMTKINGIYYVQINSASYRWVGGDYQQVRYSKEIDAKHKWIKYTIPYRESLFTFMKIEKNKITLEPRKTEFVGPGPKELGMPDQHPHDPIVPAITGFKMKLKS
ncbi:metallophosphoesterase family protein [Flagellimonas myxillae]|uniref:metallophosphoesterase family protein n=1 Tax=Flagellimonas myxillae TaxID=2942214 RepID=UPI00201F0175|nr:metallophosphoesterase family protein [Muricauda myxillae]MCL6267106.1 metallophosphoesterase family protein [Muricauda myxillae]